jgi:uncharacterized protein (TIGR03067 family)
MTMRFGLLVIPLILVGCGPTAVTTAPPTVNIVRGDDQSELSGTWKVAHLELPPDSDPDDFATLKASEFTLNGDLLKILNAGDPNPLYFRVQRDQKASPKTMQLTRTDDKGQPVVPVDKSPATLFAIYKYENELVSVAISVMRDTPPRDFKASISDEDGSLVVVVHLRKKG